MNIKKYIAVLLIVIQIFVQSRSYAFAEEAVSPTPEQSVSNEQSNQTQSEQSVSQSSTQSTTQETQQSVSPTPAQTNNDDNLDIDGDDDYDGDADEVDNAARKYREALKQAKSFAEAAAVPTPVIPMPTAPATANATAGTAQNGQTGTSEVKTGDATSTATVATIGNQNASASPTGSGQGASIINSGNGTQSNNNGSATIGNNSTTNQVNTANVNTKLVQDAVSGANTTSDNVGDSSIKTGDANVTGTVITAVNTNVDGVMVSEFNIADDHVGDILLDFAANCVSGCGTGDTSVANTGNGSNSVNDADLQTKNNNVTFQNNDATIGSELILSADSGNNEASRNTGGDSNITTGDANVSANALTFANNNIAGDVVYAVVNIFGDLIGDILFPESAMNSCCGSQTNVANKNNGSGSTNTSDVNVENSSNTFQNNDADLTNTLVFDAQTGNNDASRNTGGDSSVTTGDTYVDANVLNVANTNLVGGNMWLVIVNEAGNWIGKILGAPEGANFAGSQGTEFNVDQNGYITASNNGNGSGSNNTSSVDQSNTNTTIQNNDANVNNTLQLSANTGGNQTNDNTGGNSQIKTGDAKIVANLVNFVNNNIVGSGKLFVTVVNVFGNWMGDFVSPGQKQEEKKQTQQAIGGPSNSNESNSNNSQKTTKNTAKTQVTPTQQPTPIQAYAVANKQTTHNTQASGSSNAVLAAKAKTNPTVKKKAVVASAVLGETDTKTKVRINLAWLLLLLPFIGFFATKRILLPKFRK